MSVLCVNNSEMLLRRLKLAIHYPMKTWLRPMCLFLLSVSSVSAQQVVRITEPNAINPAEVSIAINPQNPDNMIAASFQTGLPPKPRAGSYHYVTFDGGKTWT